MERDEKKQVNTNLAFGMGPAAISGRAAVNQGSSNSYFTGNNLVATPQNRRVNTSYIDMMGRKTNAQKKQENAQYKKLRKQLENIKGRFNPKYEELKELNKQYEIQGRNDEVSKEVKKALTSIEKNFKFLEKKGDPTDFTTITPVYNATVSMENSAKNALRKANKDAKKSIQKSNPEASSSKSSNSLGYNVDPNTLRASLPGNRPDLRSKEGIELRRKMRAHNELAGSLESIARSKIESSTKRESNNQSKDYLDKLQFRVMPKSDGKGLTLATSNTNKPIELAPVINQLNQLNIGNESKVGQASSTIDAIRRQKLEFEKSRNEFLNTQRNKYSSSDEPYLVGDKSSIGRSDFYKNAGKLFKPAEQSKSPPELAPSTESGNSGSGNNRSIIPYSNSGKNPDNRNLNLILRKPNKRRQDYFDTSDGPIENPIRIPIDNSNQKSAYPRLEGPVIDTVASPLNIDVPSTYVERRSIRNPYNNRYALSNGSSRERRLVTPGVPQVSNAPRNSNLETAIDIVSGYNQLRDLQRVNPNETLNRRGFVTVQEPDDDGRSLRRPPDNSFTMLDTPRNSNLENAVNIVSGYNQLRDLKRVNPSETLNRRGFVTVQEPDDDGRSLRGPSDNSFTMLDTPVLRLPSNTQNSTSSNSFRTLEVPSSESRVSNLIKFFNNNGNGGNRPPGGGSSSGGYSNDDRGGNSRANQKGSDNIDNQEIELDRIEPSSNSSNPNSIVSRSRYIPINTNGVQIDIPELDVPSQSENPNSTSNVERGTGGDPTRFQGRSGFNIGSNLNFKTLERKPFGLPFSSDEPTALNTTANIDKGLDLKTRKRPFTDNQSFDSYKKYRRDEIISPNNSSISVDPIKQTRSVGVGTDDLPVVKIQPENSSAFDSYKRFNTGKFNQPIIQKPSVDKRDSNDLKGQVEPEITPVSGNNSNPFALQQSRGFDIGRGLNLKSNEIQPKIDVNDNITQTKIEPEITPVSGNNSKPPRGRSVKRKKVSYKNRSGNNPGVIIPRDSSDEEGINSISFNTAQGNSLSSTPEVILPSVEKPSSVGSNSDKRFSSTNSNLSQSSIPSYVGSRSASTVSSSSSPIEPEYIPIKTSNEPEYQIRGGYDYRGTANRIKRGEEVFKYSMYDKDMGGYKKSSILRGGERRVDMTTARNHLRDLDRKMEIQGRNSLTHNEYDKYAFLKMMDIHTNNMNIPTDKLDGVKVPIYTDSENPFRKATQKIARKIPGKIGRVLNSKYDNAFDSNTANEKLIRPNIRRS